MAYIGLGDVFVFLFFGLFAVIGSAYLQAVVNPQQYHALIPTEWVCIATCIGAQATAIIAVNNLRDRGTDKEAGKLTLAVRLGPSMTRIYIGILHLIACLSLGLAAIYLDTVYLFISSFIAGIGGAILTMLIARTDGGALNRFLGPQRCIRTHHRFEYCDLFGKLMNT